MVNWELVIQGMLYVCDVSHSIIVCTCTSCRM